MLGAIVQGHSAERGDYAHGDAEDADAPHDRSALAA
jgi:hypothetical protein